MAKTLIKIDKKIVAKGRKRGFRFRPGNKQIPKPMLIGGLILSLTLLVIGVAATYLVLIPAKKVNDSLQNIMATVAQVKVEMEGRDLSNLDMHANTISNELTLISAEVDKYAFLADSELTKGYYENLQIVKQLSQKSSELLIHTLPELKVILSAVGYKVEAGEAVAPEAGEPGNEEKVQGIIKELPRVIGLYDEIEVEVMALMETFNKLDPNYIPSIGTGNIKRSIVEAQKVTREIPAISAQLKQTLSVLPELLGSEGPTTYLVVYQNEKEMRASGGLLTSYGTMSIDKGELVGDIKAVDMWDLEGYVSWTLGIDVGYRNIYGQRALMEPRLDINYFGCGSAYLRAQDAGIYPDLYLSLDIFKDYYDIASKYNPAKYPAYDHILILNTFFASDIISLVEPLDIEGAPEQITAENAAKVIFGETSSQPFDPAIRKSFIGEVATELKDKFNQMSSSDFPRILQKIIRTTQAKNIAFYSKDEKVQAYFDELGLSGRTEQNFAGDYFQLSEAQVCGLKSNFYLYDFVTQDVVIEADGTIKKQVHIDWINEKVYDPKEPYIISSSPNFQYRAWIRVLGPAGTDFTATDGLEKSKFFYRPQEYFDEDLQKQVSDNVIWFDHRRLRESDPIRTHQLNVNYTLPASIRYSDDLGYRMLIQKHPGKKDERYVININYNGSITTADFRLDRDKVLTFRGGAISIANYDTRLDQYYELLEDLKGEQVE